MALKALLQGSWIVLIARHLTLCDREFPTIRGPNIDPKKSRALIARTPTKAPPIYGKSHSSEVG